MVLSKEEIWDRIRVKSVWLTDQRTPFFEAAEEHMHATLDVLVEAYIRYVVCLLFQGNATANQSANVEKILEDGTYVMKWSDIQVAAAAMPQIPQGAYGIEDPIIAFEGGTNLYGQVDGNSINLTITYWDSDI